MKKQTLQLNVRPLWKLGKWHNQHLSGAGQMDSRPKRQRTRQDQKRKAIRDGW